MNLKLALVNIQLKTGGLKAVQNSFDMFSVFMLKTRILFTYAVTKRSRILFSKTLLMKS